MPMAAEWSYLIAIFLPLGAALQRGAVTIAILIAGRFIAGVAIGPYVDHRLSSLRKLH